MTERELERERQRWYAEAGLNQLPLRHPGPLAGERSRPGLPANEAALTAVQQLRQLAA